MWQKEMKEDEKVVRACSVPSGAGAAELRGGARGNGQAEDDNRIADLHRPVQAQYDSSKGYRERDRSAEEPGQGSKHTEVQTHPANRGQTKSRRESYGRQEVVKDELEAARIKKEKEDASRRGAQKQT
jgi:hypothetical protein